MKTLLSVLMVCLFTGSLSSFSSPQSLKNTITVHGANNSPVPVTISYGLTTFTLANGETDNDEFNYSEDDGFSVNVSYPSIHSSATYYAHIYADGSLVGTLTLTSLHPSRSFLFLMNPTTSATVVCDTTP